MNNRQAKIIALKDEYCIHLVEGKNADELTSFDKEVLAALDALFVSHRDIEVPPECASLGFVLRSKAKFIGCRTVPCSPGGKMPFEKFTSPCALIQSMCDRSPMQMVQESNDDTT